MNELLQRIERLEKRYLTLYHRSYARVVRRDADRKMVDEARKLGREWGRKRQLLHSVAIAAGKKPGCKPVYLTTRERTKFMDWLRHDFRRGAPR